MGSGGVSLQDIFERVTNNPEDCSSKTFLNVSTSTYCRNPEIYTILNAVILSKLGADQIILLGKLTPEKKIENWKEFLEELVEKTTLIIRFGNEERKFNGGGDIKYAEFPHVINKNIVDILTKEGEEIRNPFVWEDNGIRRGKDPCKNPYYTNGILAHRLVILLPALGPEKFRKYLNIQEGLEKILKDVHLAYGCGSKGMDRTVSNVKRAKILQENGNNIGKIILYVFPEFAIVGSGGIKRTAIIKIYKNGKLTESFEYNRGDDPGRLIEYLKKAKRVEIYMEIPRIYCKEGASNSSIKKVFENTIPKYQELRIYL